MSKNRSMATRQPAPNRPMAVRKVDGNPQKKSGCGGFGAAMFIFVILGLVLLMLTGILPSPFEAQVTPPPQTDSSSTTVYFISPPGGVTPEPSAQATPIPEATATEIPAATLAPTPSNTPRAMPFVSQDKGSFPNSMLHPQYKCEEYLFIGGEVWDLRDSPVLGLVVRLTGSYGGELVDFSSESGDVKLYGQSGFEFVVANKQIAEDKLVIQLFDQNEQALSAPVKLATTGLCDANLLIINFKQVQEISDN